MDVIPKNVTRLSNVPTVTKSDAIHALIIIAYLKGQVILKGDQYLGQTNTGTFLSQRRVSVLSANHKVLVVKIVGNLCIAFLVK